MKRLLGFLAVSMAAALLMPAGIALAAEATAAATPFQVDVQVWPDDQPGQSTIIVLAQLATATPLPARVRLPLPAGATVTWAGEIHNGPAQNDVQRQVKIVEDKGGKSVEFDLAGSRIAQYEAAYPASAKQANRLMSKVIWIQSSPAGNMSFGFKLPPGATDVQSDPPYMGKPASNALGETLYSIAGRKLAPGAKLELSLGYVPKAGTAAGIVTGGTTGSTRSIVLPTLVALLVVVLAAIVYIVLKQSRSQREDEDA